MLIRELGEDALIARLTEDFKTEALGGPGDSKQPEYPAILKALGDDASVTLVSKETCQLVTIDTLSEGTHFDLGYTPPFYLGRKAVSVSLSDIAAMGGVPGYLLTAVSLPPELNVDFALELYRGIRECAEEYGVSLIGGNTAKARTIAITTVVIGEAKKDEVVYRAGAAPGDTVFVTGTLGDSALGLKALKEAKRDIDEIPPVKGPFKDAVMKHLDPTPRVDVGRLIAGKGLATSMTDLSDGLLRDLGHIAAASRVSATVELAKLPLSGELKEHIRQYPDSVHLALAGGEDYELLFTAAPEKSGLVEALKDETGLRVSAIGHIGPVTPVTKETEDPKAEAVKVVTPDGSPFQALETGYDHFA